MAKEEWRPIDGFPRHQISSHGRVLSTCQTKPRIMRPFVMTGSHAGYRRIQLNKEGCRYLVHRLVLTAFVGPCPPGHECNHQDGDKGNNHLENLSWVTASENNRHAYAVLGKKSQQGSAHGRSRLTEPQVLEIRALRAQGVPGAALAKQFNCSQATISGIIKRHTWTNI